MSYDRQSLAGVAALATVAGLIIAATAYAGRQGGAESEPHAAPPAAEAAALEQRGRYIVVTAGCNDCHTSGYMEAAGDVPEQEWMTGDTLGWRGPWGTTYPANLRRVASAMSMEQWLVYSGNLRARPPMPWFNLTSMNDDDRAAIWYYLRSLGPSEREIPAYLPPGAEATTPYMDLTVQIPAARVAESSE